MATMSEDDLNLLEPKILPPPQLRSRRWLAFLIGLFVLAGLGWGGLRQFSGQPTDASGRVLNPYHRGFLYRVQNFFFPSDHILEGQTDDRVNILLLGIGGPGHDGPYLSDTNIVVSIKPSTKELALMPVPRDLAADVSGHGWRKINSANAFGEAENPGGGGEVARAVFENTFKLPIPYYVRVDFTAFRDIVNALDGVTINIPRAFTDTQFPAANFAYQTIHFNAGEQTINGEQALNYARSRHGDNGEGSDFARGKRQELLLTAIRAKAMSAGTLLNPGRAQGIFEALNNHVATNLTWDQLLYLANLARDFKLPAKTIVLDSSPGGYLINTTGEDGAFLLSPKTGNFNEITTALAGVFSAESTSSIVAEAPTAPSASYLMAPATTNSLKLEVQNGTWRAGLAARIGERLSAQGFSVIRVGNSLQRPIEHTTIYLLNNKAPSVTVKKLSKLLQAPYITVLPDWLAENYDIPSTPENEQGMKYNTGTDLLIILGADTKE